MIIQRVLTSYRESFFERLRLDLAEASVDLEVLVGPSDDLEKGRGFEGKLPWAVRTNSRVFRLGRRRLVWQSVLGRTQGADLVVVEPASRLLVNYVLLSKRLFGGPKIAFWGHGKNITDVSSSAVGEWLKRRLICSADWWFAYTENTAKLVIASGYPRERVTILRNSTDTVRIMESRAAVSGADEESVRRELGIDKNSVVGLVLGSVYSQKRPQFMVDAADSVRREITDFHLLIVGDGPLTQVYESAALSRSWMHVLGRQENDDLARYASVASAMLNPGLLGLAVLDAFALGLPVVLCELAYNAPEAAYVQPGLNAIVLPGLANSEHFAQATIALLRDSELRAQLSVSAVETASSYSTEDYARNFADGVLGCLGVL